MRRRKPTEGGKDPRPSGWGTSRKPTALGAFRSQINLADSDLECLASMTEISGMASRVRLCIKNQSEILVALGGVAPLESKRLAEQARAFCGLRPSSPKLYIWNQWLRPSDIVYLGVIMRALGIRSRSQAVRYAIRAECAQRKNHET